MNRKLEEKTNEIKENILNNCIDMIKEFDTVETLSTLQDIIMTYYARDYWNGTLKPEEDV